MSAALIWIILPGILGFLMIFLRNSGPRLFLISAVFSLVLTWIAWQIPIDSAMQLGPVTLKISSTLTILGRDFTILDNERPMIGLIYLASTLWLFGGYLALPGSLFIGISQIIVALLVAALSVEPFLYAAMLIGIAVLISVPLLSSPGKPPGAGLLRFITFQLFGIPFILFVGWLLTGVEASPGNLSLVLRAGILLGLGFAFLLAVFPFHSWIPMLASEGHPYFVGFLLLFLPSVISLFALGFFDRFAWLRETEFIFQLMIAVGALVSLIGGTWVAVQNHLGRQMGYAIVYEIGLSLIALGLGGHQAVQLTFGLIISRSIALLIWAIALSGLWQATGASLRMSDLKEIAARHPFLLSGLVLAMFSFGGLPLSAGFAPKFALLTSVWTASPIAGAATLLGSAGFVVGGLRVVFALSSTQQPDGTTSPDELILQGNSDALLTDGENPFAWLYLVFGGGLLLLMGLLPQLFFGDLASFLSVFSQLTP
jgi:formate hydrogenlyase subunit 3/multisubunit Na+/H+ antiporter MnhD subunit